MTTYRIWTRHAGRVLLTSGPRAGRIAADSWQAFPESYASMEHAERVADAYKRNAPLRQFLVLPDGEQPT